MAFNFALYSFNLRSYHKTFELRFTLDVTSGAQIHQLPNRILPRGRIFIHLFKCEDYSIPQSTIFLMSDWTTNRSKLLSIASETTRMNVSSAISQKFCVFAASLTHVHQFLSWFYFGPIFEAAGFVYRTDPTAVRLFGNSSPHVLDFSKSSESITSDWPNYAI